MIIKQVTVGAAQGIHARPAALLVQKAKDLGVDITLGNADGKEVPATNMMGLLSLKLGHGDTVIIVCEDASAEAAVDQLAEMFARDLDAGL